MAVGASGQGLSRCGKGALALVVLGVCVLFLGLAATPVLASEHLEVTGEYGKEGPKATGVGNGCHLAYNSSTGNLYLSSDAKIYGLAITPGTATPLGPPFPFNAVNSSCGEPDMEVDPVTGNLYAVTSGGTGTKVFGWNSQGQALPAPWPLTVPEGTENCGIDVSGTGEVWAGNYSVGKIFKYTAAGVSKGSIAVGFNFCKFTVDHSTRDVYVAPYGGGEIVKFTAASGYTTQVKFPSAGTSNPGMAVNGAEEKLYVGDGSSDVRVYNTSTGGLVETVALGGGGGQGLAVDENTDTLFVTVGSGETGVIKEWLGLTTPKATTGEPTGNSEVSGTADPNGVGPITECYFEYGLTSGAGYEHQQACTEATPISSTETVHADLPGLVGEETYRYRLVLTNGEPHVIGRGAEKTITPHNVKGLRTEAASEVTQESATLNASFEGTGEDTHYYFEYGQTIAYGHLTAIPPGNDAGAPTGVTPISTAVTGLEPGITYHYRVVGENSIGISRAADKTFRTNELPAILAATTSHITESSAEIDATINPHEFETEYLVEYGPTTGYGLVAPIPSGTIPAGNTPQAVAIQLTGLVGVPYHFRVVATNRWGTVRTEDQSFNFYPQVCPNSRVREQNESQYLPDCRSYELVSPEETGSIELGNVEFTIGPYATNPPRFAFNGSLGGIKGAGESTNSGSDTFIATRTSSGWKTHLVGLRGYEGQGAGPLFANPDFSKFFDLDEPGAFEGQPQPPHHVPYIWDSEGNLVERWPADHESIPGAEEFEGAYQPSPDLTHLAFSSNNVRFTEDGLTVAPGSAYDYNAITGTTTLISKTAGGQNIPQEPGNVGATDEAILFPGVPDIPNEYGYGRMAPPQRSAVSTNGSHILMSTASAPFDHFNEPAKPTRLYMRVNDAVTYEVSRQHDVTYVGMTADGREVYFTSTERLNAEDTDNSIDLYMWSEAGDRLTLVSKGAPGAEGSGNGDACTATWIAGCGVLAVKGKAETDNAIASESGDIYFFSPEQLDGTKGVPNQENLYVYRDGAPAFVTTLNAVGGAAGAVTRMQVAPDGSHMAFVTASPVTSYDNSGFEEMYTFDPAERKVVCVSCLPDGQPPTANVVASKMGLFMSNDGLAFFSTEDPLVPADTNQQIDVYEYVEGRAQLITTGTGTSQSKLGGFGGSGNKGSEGLAGVSADGVNVYFSTRDVLVPQNKNGPFLAFYDARVNGGFSYSPPPAPCEAADECHGEGSHAPTAASIASEANMGDRGNAPNPAKKHHKKKHAKKKHHKKKNKAARSRRAAQRKGKH